MNRVAGVDGCKGGWVAIVLREGRFERAALGESLDDLFSTLEVEVIAIDMPAGLLESGTRECETRARERLGNRSATVFQTPPRAVLLAATYEEANRLSFTMSGRKISRQAYGLRARILELEHHLADPRIIEVHPELSFLALSGEASLPPKKTWAGQQRRSRALAAAGIEVPSEIDRAGVAAPDDVLDAAAAAWSAARCLRGEATGLGLEAGQLTQTGRRIAIWY